MQEIQWYPGHMARSLKELKEMLKLCDCVVEVTDARCPRAARNPELSALSEHKKRLLFLNKEDLADPEVTEAWCQEFRAEGLTVLSGDGRSRRSGREIEQTVLKMHQKEIERAKARGRKTRPIRVLVAGIPNVGKSSVINSILGKKKKKTANRPGVTRQLSWTRVGNTLALLDSPGILMPKIETRRAQIMLGAVAALPDENMPLEELAAALLLIIEERAPEALPLSGTSEDPAERGRELLHGCGEARSFLRQEGEVDIPRTARAVLTEFRRGDFGRISLELPRG